MRPRTSARGFTRARARVRTRESLVVLGIAVGFGGGELDDVELAVEDDRGVGEVLVMPENGGIRLQPANENYEPIVLPANQVQIKGVVIGLMRKYRG